MLNKIKSPYIKKGIISFLNEKRKLSLFIYNKKIQNIFDINIINYKLFKGVYKIAEKNGKGKEYNC